MKTDRTSTTLKIGNYFYNKDVTYQKDYIDIILIVVSSLIIIASFTYLFFV